MAPIATIPAEAIALWMVAVRTALVRITIAQRAAKPATVRRFFKARITDTRVFYAARSADKNSRCEYRVPDAYAYPVDKLNAL